MGILIAEVTSELSKNNWYATLEDSSKFNDMDVEAFLELAVNYISLCINRELEMENLIGLPNTRRSVVYCCVGLMLDALDMEPTNLSFGLLQRSYALRIDEAWSYVHRELRWFFNKEKRE